jgi:hypothetical protein
VYAVDNGLSDSPCQIRFRRVRIARTMEEGLAALYACPLASTNGQTRGFLVSKVSEQDGASTKSAPEGIVFNPATRCWRIGPCR